ncbi:MAG: alcohol dehydrogenase [Candidatus Abyssobacteria bacterium SURF_5]|uniref:Alcohol dehydrogenase n=1 Tax=Abyssobacteria bacterium (strain SURF_5) TaxID=2093360 RepID=A0A3A4NU12_ABYX5|nr:MAG: alcohol dehydrogenase [Candidatus Abyssubacteria bacterium SURF_5]
MKAVVASAEKQPRRDYVLSEFEKSTGKAIQGFKVWKNPSLEVKEVSDPRPGPTDVIVEVKAAGICGSDVHFYETTSDGYILYPGLTKFPVIIGHEFAGEIVEVGAGVRDFRVGDRVTAEEMVWCGYCRACRDGYPNHCHNLEEIGFTIDGADAKYVAVPFRLCWKVESLFEHYPSSETAWEVAATTEPTCVAYNGIFERAGGFRPGAHVVIYGGGPIGLAAVALCRTAGAASITCFELSAKRRTLAAQMGADHVFDPRSVVPHQVVLDVTNGEGADLQVEAAGSPTKTIPQMERALAINGKVCVIGRAAEPVPTFFETYQVRRSQIYGSQGHSGHGTFPSVIRLMGAGRVDTSPMITARFPLTKAVDAIKFLSENRDEGKIMLRP